jgi:hypothetical protein
MIALLAASILSMGQAKASIGIYEHRYWQSQGVSAVTSVVGCKRHSAKRVVCLAYTRIVEGETITHITTKDTVTLLQHNIVQIHSGSEAQIETEETLGPERDS